MVAYTTVLFNRGVSTGWLFLVLEGFVTVRFQPLCEYSRVIDFNWYVCYFPVRREWRS